MPAAALGIVSSVNSFQKQEEKEAPHHTALPPFFLFFFLNQGGKSFPGTLSKPLLKSHWPESVHRPIPKPGK